MKVDFIRVADDEGETTYREDAGTTDLHILIKDGAYIVNYVLERKRVSHCFPVATTWVTYSQAI